MKRNLSENEIKATIIHKLDRRGFWGGHTQNKDLLEKDIAKKLKRNGGIVNNVIQDMIRGEN